jgi:putative phosphoesterase
VADVRIGLISDTHGLLRPQAVAALGGSGLILHGGDIGDPAILEELGLVAPVMAVRGNNDVAAWAGAVPATQYVRVADVGIYVLHDLKDLVVMPPPAPVDVIVAGHSHRPGIERRADGVLMVNPGSAGRRRFRLPVSVGMLEVDGRDVHARIVELDV